eukprot:TRINITY_DN627_c2_g1_i1.p1 TRINITY_DN627_c2_g1~~TRINITY_DN627_c2_g1_i1.p1  ORF type:complete len:125 (-),score=14.47 TRINITY_DN627_c2_g1_i1:336-710(-)
MDETYSIKKGIGWYRQHLTCSKKLHCRKQYIPPPVTFLSFFFFPFPPSSFLFSVLDVDNTRKEEKAVQISTFSFFFFSSFSSSFSLVLLVQYPNQIEWVFLFAFFSDFKKKNELKRRKKNNKEK